MSDAKRDNSVFRLTGTAGRTPLRSRPGITQPQPTSTAELRLTQSWENAPAQGSDPYNAVGTRATLGTGQRM